jgi:hypothetical protein
MVVDEGVDIGLELAGRTGSTGCSRSSACIWLFSSTLRTIARVGGDR